MNYIDLRPRQLVEMRTKKPVAYIGLGILEWHGLHNPLGLDGIKANAVKIETSLLMRLRPELVDLNELNAARIRN